MSVLKSPYVTPSRVRGLYRYLLQALGRRESYETITRLMSPRSLRGKDKKPEMVRDTINECLKIGLIVVDGDEVMLNPTLPEAVQRPDANDCLLAPTLARLMFAGEESRALDGENESNDIENRDLGLVISWYLAQNAYDAPRDWNTFEEALGRQTGADRLGVTNNARYGQFEDWACYLGFAWRHSLRKEKVLTPDPTAFVRNCLKEIFEPITDHRLPIAQVVRVFGRICPVLEGGDLRDKVERKIGPREENHLSSVTAHAWMRLRDEGLVELSRDSDAEVYVFPDGRENRRFSHIIWLGGQ